MINYILGTIIALLLTIWILVIVPSWVLGMLWVGRFQLLPDLPVGPEFWAYVAADYLTPIVIGVLLYWLIKRNKRTHNA